MMAERMGTSDGATFDPSGPRHYLTIKVDDPATPSQDVDGQPAWQAVLTEEGTDRGIIEAVHTGGPAEAVMLAVDILERARIERYIGEHPA